MHLTAGPGETIAHDGIVDQPVDGAKKIFIGPIVAMQFEAMPGLGDTGSIVVTIPDIGHDQRRLSEVEALREAVVPAMVNDCIGLRNHRWLWIPAGEMHVGRRCVVGVEIVADIDQHPIGPAGEHATMMRFSRSVSPAPRLPKLT